MIYNKTMLCGAMSRYSFLGLVLTLELWVLSYFQVSHIRGCNVMALASGGVHWLHYQKPPQDPAGGWYWEGFSGLTTAWVPDVSSSPWGDWVLSVPFWLPAFVLAVFPFASFCSSHRRRRRQKSGLCPQCGYDLRGHRRAPAPGNPAIRCPECGTEGRSPMLLMFEQRTAHRTAGTSSRGPSAAGDASRPA